MSEELVEALAEIIGSRTFRYRDEAELQELIAEVLAATPFTVHREVDVGHGRIDLVVDRVGIEVKVDGARAKVARQLDRYCSFDHFGYELEHLFLNSMFFEPCPQSRDRYYCVATRRGNRKPDLRHRPRAFCASEQCGGALVDAVQVYKPAKRTWPLPAWGKYLTQYDYRCPTCSRPVHPASWMALSAIDLTDLGPTLGERKAAGKPVAPNTSERVRRATKKYWHAPPVLLPEAMVRALQLQVTHPDPSDRARTLGEPTATLTNKNGQGIAVAPLVIKANGSIAEQLFTQGATDQLGSAFLPVLRGDHDQDGHPADPLDTLAAGGNHHAIATALFSKINGGPGDTAWHGIDEPLDTITGRGTTGLVLLPWIDQWRSDPALLTEQLATVTTHLRMSLAAAPPYDGDITDEMLDQVHFRMLNPDPELRRAMAFGDDYILLGTKEKMTAGLGNAVTPPVASWITERCLATLRGAS